MFFVIPWWHLRRLYILSMYFGVFFLAFLLLIYILFTYKKKKKRFNTFYWSFQERGHFAKTQEKLTNLQFLNVRNSSRIQESKRESHAYKEYSLAVGRPLGSKYSKDGEKDGIRVYLITIGPSRKRIKDHNQHNGMNKLE